MIALGNCMKLVNGEEINPKLPNDDMSDGQFLERSKTDSKLQVGDNNMEKKIGLIGCGNMGSAILEGLLKSKMYSKEDIIVSAKSKAHQDALAKDYGVTVTSDNEEVAKAEIVFLAVKPYMFAEVIGEIKDVITKDTVMISIAAGQTIDAIEKAFGKDIILVRSMPNTPALVGEGMSALCPNKNVDDATIKKVLEIFSTFGKASVVPESMMDAVIGVSGSSPAYVYMFIEALADGAVAEGMPRNQAYEFAAQSVYGAAKMVLETGKHPGELKDAVCSPGGTTIAGVAALEEAGLRAAVIAGEHACVEKSREMSK